VLRKLKPLSFLSLEVFSQREKLHVLLVENFLIKAPVPLCIVVEHKEGMKIPQEEIRKKKIKRVFNQKNREELLEKNKDIFFDAVCR
jgi:hypothetical protein